MSAKPGWGWVARFYQRLTGWLCRRMGRSSGGSDGTVVTPRRDPKLGIFQHLTNFAGALVDKGSHDLVVLFLKLDAADHLIEAIERLYWPVSDFLAEWEKEAYPAEPETAKVFTRLAERFHDELLLAGRLPRAVGIAAGDFGELRRFLGRLREVEPRFQDNVVSVLARDGDPAERLKVAIKDAGALRDECSLMWREAEQWRGHLRETLHRNVSGNGALLNEAV